MLDILAAALRTLGAHVGAALWALGVFACGFILALAVVRLDVKSLLVLPQWLLRLARKYLSPDLNPALLFAFIFGFNTAAIFCYMLSGGLIFLPIVFDLFTGLNVGAIMLIDAHEPVDEPAPRGTHEPPMPARAWVGFLSMFVVVAELSAFWLAIGMGMKLGHRMQADFAWATFVREAGPRIFAYVFILVPALAASALAETLAIKAMLGRAGSEQ